ncbi:hypothetical protein BKP44_16210 [Formosa algae]|nr:hypothetical protein BKP44_16210 [Formosa algae]
MIVFGTLILRLDVAYLFVLGLLYGKFQNVIGKKVLISATVIITLFVGLWSSEYLKFPLYFLIFIMSINLNFKFFNTGRYSYLLHLYHAPIIVITYPILSLYIVNPILKIFTQIFLALFFVFLLFLLIKRFEVLKILSGGR